METEGQEFGFVRSTLLDNLSVMEYHKRTLDMVASLDEQIKRLTEESANISEDYHWKNPREESIHLHNVKTLSVLKRQRARLTDKLTQI